MQPLKELKERIDRGETLEEMTSKVKELIGHIDTLIKNMKTLCNDTGHDLIASYDIGLICQLNVSELNLITYIAGTDKNVNHTLDSLTNIIKKKQEEA